MHTAIISILVKIKAGFLGVNLSNHYHMLLMVCTCMYSPTDPVGRVDGAIWGAVS